MSKRGHFWTVPGRANFNQPSAIARRNERFNFQFILGRQLLGAAGLMFFSPRSSSSVMTETALIICALLCALLVIGNIGFSSCPEPIAWCASTALESAAASRNMDRSSSSKSVDEGAQSIGMRILWCWPLLGCLRRYRSGRAEGLSDPRSCACVRVPLPNRPTGCMTE